MYSIGNVLETFPISEVIPLLQQAVDAANNGEPFNETITVDNVDIFVALRHENGIPMIDIGQDHQNLISPEVLESLKETPGLTVDHQAPWLSIQLKEA